MRLIDIIKLSVRMFKARTMRTLLTILGMGVGISAILFLVSLGYGLQKTILERITTADALVTLDVSSVGAQAPPLTKESINAIKDIPGVVEVSPSVQLQAQGKLDNLTLDLATIATNPTFFRLNGTKAANGILPDNAHPDGALITSSIVSIFGKQPDEIIGQKIQLTIFKQQKSDQPSENNKAGQGNFAENTLVKTYTVVGITEGDENLVYVPLNTIDGEYFDHFNQVKVKSDSTGIMAQVREQLLSQNLEVSSLSETIDQANKVFQAVQLVLMMFGVIALIVSAIGMFNTMTIALLERTEEIGIMKSIGASNWHISVMFVMEATIMGFLGSIGGVGLGYLAGAICNSLLNLVATRLGGQSMQLFYIPLWFVGMVILFGSFVGFLTGVLPARKASKIDTLDALRYK